MRPLGLTAMVISRHRPPPFLKGARLLKIQLNPNAHPTLIKSDEPLPSQLLKNTAALNSGLLAEARVERCVQPQPIVIAARAERAVTRLIPDP